MTLFEEIACDVFERVYRDRDASPPDDIVHVSCSGYVSPSPVQMFLSRRGWLDVGVTHSYHMGCYGAFPAVRTALGLVGSSYVRFPTRKRRVDLVHTEFLSLHFDLLGEEADNSSRRRSSPTASSSIRPIRSPSSQSASAAV